MTLVDALVLFVAVGALAVGAFILVNGARVYAAMVKANADIIERGAQYMAVLQGQVDRRVEVINESIKKTREFVTKPLGPGEPEPPTPDELRGPNRVTEDGERAREIAEAGFEWHPDALRRDQINVE